MADHGRGLPYPKSIIDRALWCSSAFCIVFLTRNRSLLQFCDGGPDLFSALKGSDFSMFVSRPVYRKIRQKMSRSRKGTFMEPKEKIATDREKARNHFDSAVAVTQRFFMSTTFCGWIGSQTSVISTVWTPNKMQLRLRVNPGRSRESVSLPELLSKITRFYWETCASIPVGTHL